MERVSTAVAKAACESGVAKDPVKDWDDYKAYLKAMVVHDDPRKDSLQKQRTQQG